MAGSTHRRRSRSMATTRADCRTISQWMTAWRRGEEGEGASRGCEAACMVATAVQFTWKGWAGHVAAHAARSRIAGWCAGWGLPAAHRSHA